MSFNKKIKDLLMEIRLRNFTFVKYHLSKLIIIKKKKILEKQVTAISSFV